MLYSRFDAARGEYAVYEDGAHHALNGDFPVPQLGAEINSIGVPASEAGRRLPAGARYIGHSWHARGLVVNAAPSALGMTQAELGDVVVPVALIAGTAVALVWIFPRLFWHEGR